MVGYNTISRYNYLGLDFEDFGRHFWYFGTTFITFGINLGTLGSLLEHFGCTFRIKKQIGAPKVPKGAPPPFRGHPFGYLFEAIFLFFLVLKT